MYLRDIPQHLGVQVLLNARDYYCMYVHATNEFCCHTERSVETYEDKLRSIVAQLEYTHNVIEYDKAGVPFCSHLYVPEVHPITHMEYHEREDDAHVLKVRG